MSQYKSTINISEAGNMKKTSDLSLIKKYISDPVIVKGWIRRILEEMDYCAMEGKYGALIPLRALMAKEMIEINRKAFGDDSIDVGSLSTFSISDREKEISIKILTSEWGHNLKLAMSGAVSYIKTLLEEHKYKVFLYIHRHEEMLFIYWGDEPETISKIEDISYYLKNDSDPALRITTDEKEATKVVDKIGKSNNRRPVRQ